ncbi:MAG TPA: phenylalanine--tRNA ligase beta subunit-related protein [Geminicoccaceae bacterium]|nr:phenylalanine--tRNA ligase beta subunit-related protein [Geminicoccaceae bacterium]
MHRPDRTSPFAPVVDPAVWHLRPDFVALSLVVRGGRNAPSDARSAAALQAASEDRTTAAGWAEPHLEAWRDAYRAFGAKPQRTPCSAEALRRRARTPPTVNHLVDAYNALSLRFAVPIGGEDLTAYQGPPRLTVAVGNEPFETVKDGMAVVEQVDPGEVVWRDDRGVTCRRWNWRQTPLTRLGAHSTEMWFVVERLEPMPLAAVEEVGAALADAVRALAPGAEVERRLIRPPAGG